ncbi:MAG: hypothetical protein HYX95_01975, partial [Chloroflexi bacterium]|nr:hypothetical protein [Chloroflexota bacterium]
MTVQVNQLLLIIVTIALLFLALGGVVSYLVLQVRGNRRFRESERKVENLLSEAKEKKQQMLLEAADEAMKARSG